MGNKINLSRIAFAAGLIICFNSCRKEYPEGTSNPPVFYFNGTINGTPVLYEAGKNDYYMYSEFQQDGNNVYHFKSQLKTFNCTACPDNLEIEINDFQPSLTGGATQINNSLTPGYYAYYVPGGTPTQINVQFNSAASGGTAQSYLWDFGDGTTASTPNPLHTYNHPGIYQVCLEIIFTNSTVSTICYPVKFEVPDAGCKFLFSESAPSGNDVQFTSFQFLGTAPFQFNWDFGDGTTSTAVDPLHTYPNPGVYTVCLQVTDANNKKSDFCRNVITNGFPASYANFLVPSNSSNSNPMSLSNVIVKWTDTNGIIYTSENTGGQPSGFFKLISVENYNLNENGEATKKIKVQLKCILYNGATTIQLENAELVFAIAYPD